MILLTKFTGITLISLTCIYYGISKAVNCTEKTLFLETVKTAVITIKQQLIFTLASPEELFNALQKAERFSKYEFFSCAEKLIASEGFEKGWKQTVKNQLFLNNIEKDTIKTLADILGKSDLETQVKQLDVVICQLESIISNQKSKLDANKKLYTALGILSALTFTVLIL